MRDDACTIWMTECPNSTSPYKSYTLLNSWSCSTLALASASSFCTKV